MVYGNTFLPKKENKAPEFKLESVSVVYGEYLNRLSLLESCTNEEERSILEAQVQVLCEVSKEDIKKFFHDIFEKLKDAWKKFCDFFKGLWNKIFHSEKAVDAKLKASEAVLDKAEKVVKNNPRPASSNTSTSSTNTNTTNNSNNTPDTSASSSAENVSKSVENDTVESSDKVKEEINDIKQDLGGLGGLSKAEKKKIHDEYREKKTGVYSYMAGYFENILFRWECLDIGGNRETNKNIRNYSIGNISEYDIFGDAKKHEVIAKKIVDFISEVTNKVKSIKSINNYNTREANKEIRKVEEWLDDIGISDNSNSQIRSLVTMKLTTGGVSNYIFPVAKIIGQTDFDDLNDILTKYKEAGKVSINLIEKDMKYVETIKVAIDKNIAELDKAFVQLAALENYFSNQRDNINDTVLKDLPKDATPIAKHLTYEKMRVEGKVPIEMDVMRDIYSDCIKTIKSMNKYKNSLAYFNKNYAANSAASLLFAKNTIAENNMKLAKEIIKTRMSSRKSNNQ